MPGRRRRPKEPPTPGATIYLDWDEVHRRTSLSRSTIWRLAAQGRFPRRVKLSPGRVGWREDELVAWMNEREQNLGSYVG